LGTRNKKKISKIGQLERDFKKKLACNPVISNIEKKAQGFYFYSWEVGRSNAVHDAFKHEF
jgi:hypothetical protein